MRTQARFNEHNPIWVTDVMKKKTSNDENTEKRKFWLSSSREDTSLWRNKESLDEH